MAQRTPESPQFCKKQWWHSRRLTRWSKRENVPFWGPHTINLDAGFIDGPLRAGMTIAFETDLPR